MSIGYATVAKIVLAVSGAWLKWRAKRTARANRRINQKLERYRKNQGQ